MAFLSSFKWIALCRVCLDDTQKWFRGRQQILSAIAQGDHFRQHQISRLVGAFDFYFVDRGLSDIKFAYYAIARRA
jgi:hypothetical protein